MTKAEFRAKWLPLLTIDRGSFDEFDRDLAAIKLSVKCLACDWQGGRSDRYCPQCKSSDSIVDSE